VGDAGLGQAGQGRVLVGGQRGLGLGVFLLAAADVAAGGTAGFGQGVADEQAGQTVEAVGGLLFGQAGVEQDRGGPFDRGERGGGHRGSRAERRPAILHVGGYDGTAEELYASVAPALDRGYVFAAVDGPGQGAMLYDQRVPMRPDWENVVPGLFDAIAAQPEVDPERIILVGRSFGGLIAVRGAAGEHRLAALVVDPGQWDEGAAVIDRLGPMAKLIDDPSADPQFTALLDVPALKAMLAPRMVTNGVVTVRAYCADMKRYNNIGIAEKVTCPAFVTDNDQDEVSPGQGRILFDHLTCPKEFRLFTVAEGAQGHCEGMAPIVFWDAACNWLDTLLAR
jgi:pimeloyl-ACP methyl ester carboxylesterase